MSQLSEIRKQIEDLEKKAQAITKQERQSVIERLKIEVAEYGITASELGLSKRGRKSGFKAPRQAMYRRSSTETWGGRGPKPKWVKEIESKGEKLSNYKI